MLAHAPRQPGSWLICNVSQNMITRLFTVFAVLAGTLSINASGEPVTRIVQYLYDGGGAKTRISITSFGGGPAIMTIAADGKKPITAEVDEQDFAKIWSAFSSLPELVRAEITSSAETVDTDTHHIFFTLEKSSSGAKNHSYAVLAAKAGQEFKAWLRLLEPKEKNG